MEDIDRIFYMPKSTVKRFAKSCAACGRTMHIISYADRTYRGGHYFGKIPIHRKKDLRTAKKKFDKKLGWWTLTNLKPPSRYAEYWECPRCYWR